MNLSGGYIQTVYFNSSSNYRLNGVYSDYQRYSKKTDATTEPVTVAEMKQQLIIDSSFTDDDTLIGAYIGAARLQCEAYTGISFIHSTWTETVDYFPTCREIWLSVGNVASVTSIKYVDSDGDEQTFDSSNYIVDKNGSRCRIALAYGKSWPTSRMQANAITIEYISGFGAAASDVPEAVKIAIKLSAAYLYEKREDAVKKLPTASELFLQQYIAKQFV